MPLPCSTGSNFAKEGRIKHGRPYQRKKEDIRHWEPRHGVQELLLSALLADSFDLEGEQGQSPLHLSRPKPCMVGQCFCKGCFAAKKAAGPCFDLLQVPNATSRSPPPSVAAKPCGHTWIPRLCKFGQRSRTKVQSLADSQSRLMFEHSSSPASRVTCRSASGTRL